MNYFLKNIVIYLAALLTILSVQSAPALEIESDFNYIKSSKTTIKGLHRLFVGVPIGETLSFGQSLYSGAIGDGGGAFFWGFEGVKRFSIYAPVESCIVRLFWWWRRCRSSFR